MKKKTDYFDLPFLPNIIADTVCAREYKQQEWSVGLRSAREMAKIEALRLKMTQDQIDEFSNHCDEKCKMAYENENKWFMDIVKARGNKGRDQLYVFITHWLSAYLVKNVK